MVIRVIEEVLSDIHGLKQEVNVIQEQLHSLRPKGKEEINRAYSDWRYKAIKALRYKQVELARLKEARRLYYLERKKRIAESEDVGSMLCKLHRILRRAIADYGVLLTEEEQVISDTAQAYISVM